MSEHWRLAHFNSKNIFTVSLSMGLRWRLLFVSNGTTHWENCTHKTWWWWNVSFHASLRIIIWSHRITRIFFFFILQSTYHRERIQFSYSVWCTECVPTFQSTVASPLLSVQVQLETKSQNGPNIRIWTAASDNCITLHVLHAHLL